MTMLPLGQIAPIQRRAIAYVIDAAVMAALGLLLSGILLGLTAAAGSPEAALGVALIGGPLVFLCFFAWWIVYTYMQTGKGSLGMRTQGIRLADAETGGTISFWRALLRNVVFGAAGSIVVGYFTPLFDGTGRFQGWHDKVARSLMLDARVSGHPETSAVSVAQPFDPAGAAPAFPQTPGSTPVFGQAPAVPPAPVFGQAPGAPAVPQAPAFPQAPATHVFPQTPGSAPTFGQAPVVPAHPQDSASAPGFPTPGTAPAYPQDPGAAPAPAAPYVPEPVAFEQPAHQAPLHPPVYQTPEAAPVAAASPPDQGYASLGYPADIDETIIPPRQPAASFPQAEPEPSLIAFVPGITQDAPFRRDAVAEPVAPAEPQAPDVPVVPVAPVVPATPVAAPAASEQPAPFAADDDIEETRISIPGHRLVFIWDDGTRVSVSRRTVFGRNPSDEEGAIVVPIRDETLSLSKTHFEAAAETSGGWVLDRGSTNGTTIVRNGAHFPCTPGQRIPIKLGDVIAIGDRIVTVGGYE